MGTSGGYDYEEADDDGFSAASEIKERIPDSRVAYCSETDEDMGGVYVIYADYADSELTDTYLDEEPSQRLGYDDWEWDKWIQDIKDISSIE